MMLVAAAVTSLIDSREIKSDVFGMTIVWNVLGIRILVLVSLLLQVVLIFLGNRRKYIAKTWLRLVIWLFYLSADWIATVALGILSNNCKIPDADPNFIIMAIWAPFLLVHLGGPDTITAYSLEDNELWPRHMLGLVYQLAVAVYVVYRSWNNKPLNYVTFPIFVAGMVKYGERSWSLWSGSSKGFRKSILPSPDPGPNYAKFMDDYTAKKHEGYNVTLDEVNETTTTLLDHNSHEETGLPISNIPNVTSDDEMNESTTTVLDHNSREETGILNPNIPNAKALRDGFKFYNIPQCLFADLILSFQDHKSSQIFFQSIDWKNAFQVVAIELGLMYDMLHTKAAVTSKRIHIGLKATSVFCTILALLAFSHFTPKPINSDHIITFVLFGGAIFLEIYAAIVLFSSSRAMLWFSNHNNRGAILFYKFISWFQFYFWISHTVTWSNLMSQFNLFRFCLKAEPVKCIKIQKFFHIYNFFEKSYYQKTKQVSEELKELIFNHLKDKSEEAKDIEACKKLCAHKGDWVLEKGNCHICKQNCRIHNEQNSHIQDEKNCHICDINRSIKEVEFDESILLWHIATDLCYSSDDINCQGLNLVALQSREESQLLSDYMLNLLVICPFLLPNGIGEIRFQDTCAEVDELLKERKYIKDRSKVCKMILRVNTAIPPSQVKGDRSKSVLFDACRLAKSLQSLETEENWSKEKKWDMISNVWVEMLCHVASQCRGLNHAKQLSQGGELLTHVWLLMAHFGITEQFQISKGHVRVKLKLS